MNDRRAAEEERKQLETWHCKSDRKDQDFMGFHIVSPAKLYIMSLDK
jgi:hypothetical protein